MHEDHKAPIAAVNVWYHVGSKNEKPGRTGFAHLFEHLMFNGSEHYNNDYFKAVEPVGATDLNGTTNEDRTNYFQNVPISALDRILWLESDRMGHLLGVIDKARLDEQRGVVQNEKRQGENSPYGKSFITVAENTYPKGHPYSWSVIGSMDDLNAASLDDVKGWFADYYGAANATLVVAGDVNPQDIKQRVEKYFGHIPSGPPLIKPRAWVAKRTGVQRQSMQDRVPQTRIIKVWNVAQFGTADSTYLSLVVDLLAGGGESSRLYKRLVYRDRTATSVVGFQDDREISGQVWLWADVQPGGDAKAVERALDEEIGAFIMKGPTAEEVERTRTQSRSGFVRGIERIGGFGGKSDLLARGQVLLGDPEAYVKEQRVIQAATAADLQSAAQRWLSDGVYVLEVTPFAEYATTPDDGRSIEAARRGAAAGRTLAARADGDAVQWNQSRAGEAVGRAGRADDAGAGRRLLGRSRRLAGRGLDDRRDADARDDDEDGAAAGGPAGADCGRHRRRSRPRHVHGVAVRSDRAARSRARSVRGRLAQSRVPASRSRSAEEERARAASSRRRSIPIGVALRVLPGLLYGPGHAYAQPLTGSGTEASVNAMTRADLAAFHQAWFKPNRATLIVAGDITMEALTPKLERVLQGLEGGYRAHEEHPDRAGARARPDLHRRSAGRRTERRDFRPAHRAEEEP